MKKSKLFLGSLFSVVFSFIIAGQASANEGTIKLAGKTDDAGRCFATSVYLDGTYRILVTCRGLKMAIDPIRNRYVLWAQQDTVVQRLGEIVSGKLEAAYDEPFQKLFVSLEKEAYPSTPADEVVLAGLVEAIDFGKGVVDSSLIKPTLAVTVATKIDDRGAVVPTRAPAQTGNKLVAIVSGIGKAILIGFILLLVVVGAMGFLAKRKSL